MHEDGRNSTEIPTKQQKDHRPIKRVLPFRESNIDYLGRPNRHRPKSPARIMSNRPPEERSNLTTRFSSECTHIIWDLNGKASKRTESVRDEPTRELAPRMAWKQTNIPFGTLRSGQGQAQHRNDSTLDIELRHAFTRMKTILYFVTKYWMIFTNGTWTWTCNHARCGLWSLILV